MGMGLATTFVMTLASICAWLIDTDSDSAQSDLSAHAGVYIGYRCGGAVY